MPVAYFWHVGKLQNIIEGWANYYFPNKQIEAVALNRAAICAHCPNAGKSTFFEIIDNRPEQIQGMVCKICTCPLSKKTRSPNETCPESRWKQ
jgi:hypothetical protein